jgi:hypothetical protein
MHGPGRDPDAFPNFLRSAIPRGGRMEAAVPEKRSSFLNNYDDDHRSHEYRKLFCSGLAAADAR